MKEPCVIGYDPGGGSKSKHGLAVATVLQDGNRWRARDLFVDTETTLARALDWFEEKCDGRRIVAAGVDTLTEWATGHAGWRPADRWLRRRYPRVAKSVASPNSLYGAMVIGGAAFLLELNERFAHDGTQITEAHPKVCYFALTGRKCDWLANSVQMGQWLEEALELSALGRLSKDGDDAFDAGMAALAALRGANGEWINDLHMLGATEGDGTGSVVRPIGRTHYWWPEK